MFRLAFAALIALACLVSPTHSAKAPPDVDPSASDEPNWAYVQMQVIEISKIDGVEQAFHADFYMLTTWAAPLNDTPFTGTEDLSSADLGTYFWSPQLEFINAREDVTALVAEPYSFVPEPSFDLTALRPGYTLPSNWAWIIQDQRYQCDFTTPLSMEEFPFDTQFMQLLVESLWQVQQVKIMWAEPTLISKLIPAEMDIVGWTFLRSRQFNEVQHYPYNGADYHRLTIRCLLEREPNYYMTKIVAGAMLLVYMCIWVFSLAVDEADRMMGTLQIFAGLITYLFVAAGDVPKVPYQTRLDVFMLWCFFNVAFMLIVHGTLYYWRECDLEEMLEERQKEREREKDRLYEASRMPEIELGIGAPRPSFNNGRVYVNDPGFSSPHAHSQKSVHPSPPSNLGQGERESTKWRLRHDPWSSFTLRKWYNGLHFTRKWDAIIIPAMLIIYSVGVAVILGRDRKDVSL